jgi:hypothetical protein
VAAFFVENLQHAADAIATVVNRHRNHAARLKPGGFINASKKACVVGCVGYDDNITACGDMTRQTLTHWNANLVEFRKVGYAAAQFTGVCIEQVKGTALGAEYLNGTIDHGTQQALGAHLPRKHTGN